MRFLHWIQVLLWIWYKVTFFLPWTCLFFVHHVFFSHEYVSFSVEENSLIMNIFVHSNWCLYVFENGVVCERLQLLAVCVNRIVNVHICTWYAYICCGRVGFKSEASYPVKNESFYILSEWKSMESHLL